MKKSYHLFIIALLSLSFACKGKLTGSYGDLYVDSVLVSDSLLTLHPPMKKGSFSYDSIIKSVSYLFLETNDSVLLGRIDDIKYFNGIFYVADYQFGRIFSFDRTGRFRGKIDDIGEGPKQYKRICSFDIDRKENKLYLLDGDLGKVHVYNIGLELIDIINLPVTFVDHIALYDDKLFLELGFREYKKDDEVSPNLLLYDLNECQIKETFFHFHKDWNIHFRMNDPVAFSSCKDKLYYWSPLGHSIYKYCSSDFYKEVECDLSGYEVPVEIFSKRFSKAFELLHENKYAYIDRYYEFNDWHYVRISRMTSSAHYFYHKKSGVGFLDVSFQKNLGNGKVIMPDLFQLSDNVCCGYMVPEQYLRLVDDSLLSDINMDDNPILVFYELKK